MTKIRHISEQSIFTDTEAISLPNPSIGNIKIYRKDDGFWYEKLEDGTENPIVQISNAYTFFPIWAEEGGALSDNNTQWSFGNGSTGVISIPVPDCEVYAMALQADVGGTSVSIELMKNDIPAVSTLFTGDNDFVNLGSPISFIEGDTLGFRTDVEIGVYSDVRVVAWCRVPFTVSGIKGDKGEDGNNGVDGITNQVLRTSLNTVTNANVTGTSFIYNTSPDVNTTGTNVTINSNNIVLEPGTYSIEIMPNYSTVASGVQRPAIGARFFLDGVQYGDDHFAMSYIRDNSAHDESKDEYKDLFTISATTVFTASTIQQSTAGTVLLSGGRIIIVKYN